MKTEIYVEYQDAKDHWVRRNPTMSHKLIGFARREAKNLATDYPGIKVRVVKTTWAVVK